MFPEPLIRCGIAVNNNRIVNQILAKFNTIFKSFQLLNFAVFDQSRETDLLIITFSPESDQFEHWIKVVRKIRSHLTQKFGIAPAYVIPLERNLVPKTSIGKVQKSKLKKDFEQGLFTSLIQGIDQYLAKERQKNQTLPQSENERQIAAVWSEVLQLTSVGLEDNFFELGGHSIHLIRVQNELEKN